MMWTDRQIIAALNRASAVVERIHDALRVIGLRTSDLLMDTATSDAGEPQGPYDIARNQMDHAAIGLVTTLSAAMLGATMLVAGALAVGGWAGAWELWQHLRAIRAGVPRTRSRRDWWLGDAPAYCSGANMGMAVLAWDGSWFAGSFAGVMLVVWSAAMIFGKAVNETR